MSSPRRMRLWGLAVSTGHLALGLIGHFALHVPGALLFFGLCAALTLGLALAVAPLLRPDGPDDPGGLHRDEPEPPPWWPEFEREFRAYASRPRARA